jgi:hypothetical protein
MYECNLFETTNGWGKRKKDCEKDYEEKWTSLMFMIFENSTLDMW